MGIQILQYVRTKFGMGEPEPDSAVLGKALADIDARIDKNKADTEALERELPAAVIRSIDLGATERVKLEALQSKLGALVSTAAAIRSELAEAQSRESAEELAKAWAEAEEKGRVREAAGELATAAVITLVDAIQALLEADEQFRLSVPVQAPDWRPDFLASSLHHLIALELYVRTDGALPPPQDVWESPYQVSRDSRRATIVGAIRDHAAVAFRARVTPEKAASLNGIDASNSEVTPDGSEQPA